MLAHGAPEIFRAAHEEIAFGLRQIFDSPDDVTGPPARIVAVGGGTRSDLWPQIVSDVTQRIQEVPRVTIGASYGDALLAAVGTGAVAPGTGWSSTGRVFEPNRDHAGLYDELYAAFVGLYPKTRDEMHTLARIQRETQGPLACPQIDDSGRDLAGIAVSAVLTTTICEPGFIHWGEKNGN